MHFRWHLSPSRSGGFISAKEQKSWHPLKSPNDRLAFACVMPNLRVDQQQTPQRHTPGRIQMSCALKSIIGCEMIALD